MTADEVKRLVDEYAQAVQSAAPSEDQGTGDDLEWWEAEADRLLPIVRAAIDELAAGGAKETVDEIRIAWRIDGAPGGGLWRPASDAWRRTLAATVTDHNRQFGPGSHWIETRQA